MTNVGYIYAQKGQQLTAAHVISTTRLGFGYYVLSGCGVHQSSTPGMSVLIDSGYVQLGNGVARTAITSTTVTITAANPTLPRLDLIYINSSGNPAVYTGTPTAISPSSETDFRKMSTPAPGAYPPAGVILSLVYVGARVTSILNASINDIATYGPQITIAPTTTTSGKVPYWSSTANTLSDGYTVGTAANNLVQLDASSRLPAVSGYLLTNTATTAVLTTVGDTLVRGSSGLTRIAAGNKGQAYIQGSSTPVWTTRTFDVAFPFGDGINVIYGSAQAVRIPIAANIVAARIRSFDASNRLSGSITCTLYMHYLGNLIGTAIDTFVLSSNYYYEETGLSIFVPAGQWLTIKVSGITSCKQIVCSLTLEAT